MDKKSKNFFLIFFTAVFIVTAISFYKFYLLKDYYLKLETVCDPTKEACFIYECDPAEDSQCPENPDERVSYYKLIEKKAYALPNCNPDDPNCPPPACRAGEDCRQSLNQLRPALGTGSHGLCGWHFPAHGRSALNSNLQQIFP